MKNYMALGWFYSPKQILRYAITRVTSLKPPRTKLDNPYTILRALDKHQWNMWAVGFTAWAWDAFDFFTVSLCVTEIAKDFGKENSAVSWGITVTLMLRSVGALIFGSLSDRYGRKWVMITCLALFVVFELASGFCQTLSQFLGVRALYGISMGGLLGPAVATAMEDLPYDARGILSGVFQQGYAVGYLLAAIFYRALVPTTTHGWRSLFWFGAGPPILIIIWRISLPETNHFLIAKAEREARAIQDAEEGGLDFKTPGAFRAFARDAGKALKANWVLFVYMVVVMAGFNSISHGSQDFYPTYLKTQVGFDASQVTVTTVVGQIGALLGGACFGYISTFTGRRLAMMTGCLFGGAIVPAYILVRNDRVIACTFFEQFFVGGTWGPIPVHLTELSPPALRSLTTGLTYQLGNLASSASATIQAVIGQRFPLPPGPHGEKRFDYGRVIGIFLGAVWAYILFFLFVGPEMTQKEREKEAALALDYENIRTRGINLKDFGASKIKGDDIAAEASIDERADEKASANHVEKV